MRIPWLAILFLIIFSIATDYAIFRYIKHFSTGRALRRRSLVHGICSVIGLALIVVILCLPRRNGSDSILPVMWLLYSWITIYLSKAVWILVTSLCQIPLLFMRRKRPWHAGIYVGLPTALLVFAVLWYGALFGRSASQVLRVDLDYADLPETFSGYTIAQISDLHVGSWGSDTTFVSRLVSEVNALHPDIILFTGDIVNRNSEELRPFLPVLSRLHAPDGVWSVLGNHDYGNYQDWPTPQAHEANNLLLRQMQKEMGWHLLNNEHAFIRHRGDSILLMGVENWGKPPFVGVGDLGKAAQGVDINGPDAPFSILMTHNPEHWQHKVAGRERVNLSLSGHTHAMQITVGGGKCRWSPAALLYDLWGGLYVDPTNDQVRIYVNIGCGEVGMPYRIGAKPEITLFILRRSSAADSPSTQKR